MKRINAIVKGTANKITDFLSRKADRVIRGVDSAIDFAKDKIADLKENAEETINSFGNYAGSGDSEGLKSCIQKYCDLIETAECWEAQLARLEELKKKLNTEVKVEEE